MATTFASVSAKIGELAASGAQYIPTTMDKPHWQQTKKVLEFLRRMAQVT